jgi:hypothetical protein
MSDGPFLNTDREIYRGPSRAEWGDDDRFYADSIHVTESGGIGFNCGGHVIVMPLRKWFEAAQLADYAVTVAELLTEWLETEIDPEDEEYAPWMESFTARVRGALAKNPNPAGPALMTEASGPLSPEASGAGGAGTDCHETRSKCSCPQGECLRGPKLEPRCRYPHGRGGTSLDNSRLQSGTYSEPFDSSGGPIGADVAARRAAAEEGTQFFEEWLAALPDYFHGLTVGDMRDLFRFMPCVHQVVRNIDAFQWTGDLDAFANWFGERMPIDFRNRISVPVHKSQEGKWLGPWLSVWCGNWIIRHEGRCECVTDIVFRNFIAPHYENVAGR